MSEIETIQVFARVRPHKKADRNRYHVNGNDIDFKMDDKDESTKNFINNQKELFEFKFNGVFDQGATQAEVFEKIGKPVIDNVMKGFNGTVFA